MCSGAQAEAEAGPLWQGLRLRRCLRAEAEAEAEVVWQGLRLRRCLRAEAEAEVVWQELRLRHYLSRHVAHMWHRRAAGLLCCVCLLCCWEASHAQASTISLYSLSCTFICIS
jgi:hypothetical protein